jgi:hypothetical protein
VRVGGDRACLTCGGGRIHLLSPIILRLRRCKVFTIFLALPFLLCQLLPFHNDAVDAEEGIWEQRHPVRTKYNTPKLVATSCSGVCWWGISWDICVVLAGTLPCCHLSLGLPCCCKTLCRPCPFPCPCYRCTSACLWRCLVSDRRNGVSSLRLLSVGGVRRCSLLGLSLLLDHYPSCSSYLNLKWCID